MFLIPPAVDPAHHNKHYDYS
jgi:hypothetical protein